MVTVHSFLVKSMSLWCQLILFHVKMLVFKSCTVFILCCMKYNGKISYFNEFMNNTKELKRKNQVSFWPVLTPWGSGHFNDYVWKWAFVPVDLGQSSSQVLSAGFFSWADWGVSPSDTCPRFWTKACPPSRGTSPKIWKILIHFCVKFDYF